MTGHYWEDRAYEAIIAGWPVFPLRGKIPAISKDDGGNGHLDATLDDRQVEAWWTKYPNANIGMRPPEWLIITDIDPRSGGSFDALITAAGALPPTLRSWSGRGDGGCHLFYDRGDLGKIDRSRLPKGIDVKDHDGYVVLPPSIHPDSRKPYRWDPRPFAPLPDGLRALLTEQQVARSARPDFTRSAKLGSRLAGMLRTVANAREEDHNRNNLLNDLAFRAVSDLGLGDSVETYDAFLEAARANGLPDQQIKSTLKSAGFRS